LQEISSSDVTPALMQILDRTQPSAFRAMAVLEGECKGRIWTNDPQQPSWLIVQEGVFGTMFISGAVTTEILHPLIASLSQQGDVLVGFWPDDAATLALLPEKPMYEGFTLDFTNRPLNEGLEAFLHVPEGLQLRHMNRKLFARSIDVEFYVDMFGSIDAVLEKAIGLFLMQGENILCEAFAGTSAMGIIEIGINTREEARGKGYATLTSAYLIRACEALGYQTYWNAARQNPISGHLARKLGYRTEREYRLWAWFPQSNK
jgi:GNAT superfamily N-acetyltransferase